MHRSAVIVFLLTIFATVSPNNALAGDTEEELQDLRSTVRTLLNRIDELEQRLDQSEAANEQAASEQAAAPAPRVEPSRKPPVRVELSGRINQAIMFADNGDKAQPFIVDNDNSGSRFGVRGEADVDETTIGAFLELGFEVNTTDEISFGDEGPVGNRAGTSDFLGVRNAEWYAVNPNYGSFWLGHGNTATQKVSEVDLSGTSCCFSGSDVDDLAGGLEFETGQEVDRFFSNLDGSRTSRVRYDTPRFSGFQLSIAGRQENETIQPDASVNYAAKINEVKLESAAGWRREFEGENGTDIEASHTFHGSLSLLTPSGLNGTIAGGIETFDDDRVGIEDQIFLFGKLGWRGDLVTMGQTRFSVDGFYGEDITNAFGVAAGNFDDVVEAYSIGGGIVQVVSDFSTEIYLGARVYWVHLPGSAGIGDPDPLYALITGARVRF